MKARLLFNTLSLAVVLCAATGSFASDLTVTPDALVIDDGATVVLAARGVDAAARWVVELGELAGSDVRDGVVQASWTLPADIKPRRVAAALIEPGGVRFITVAVSRRARVRIEATPGAEVRLFLGDRLASSGTTDAHGELTLRVDVPPGNHTARVEQVTRRRGVPPRFDRLDVSDRLHVFTVPTGAALVPDGAHTLSIASFAYTDGHGGADARITVDAGKLSLETTPTETAGVRRAAISATPREAAKGDTLTVLTRARSGDLAAEHRLIVPLAALPPSTLHFVAPPQPWKAATSIELSVAAADVLGRAVPCPARVTVGPPYAGLGVDDSDGTRVRVTTPGELRGPLLLRASCQELLAEELFTLRAADPTQLSLSRTNDVAFELTVRDAFGNPVAGVPPVLAVSSGAAMLVTEEPAGSWSGVWTPEQSERREEARLSAELGAARTSTIMRHPGTSWDLALGVYGGAFAGGGAFHGPGGALTVSLGSPLWPARLRLELGAAGWYAEREQTIASNGRANRRAWLAPLGAGASWEIPLTIGWRLDVGTTAGVLLSATSLRANAGSASLVGETAGHATGFQVSPLVRLSRRLGPGAVGLLAQALVPVSRLDTFSSRPVGGGLAVGYAWEP